MTNNYFKNITALVCLFIISLHLHAVPYYSAKPSKENTTPITSVYYGALSDYVRWVGNEDSKLGSLLLVNSINSEFLAPNLLCPVDITVDNDFGTCGADITSAGLTPTYDIPSVTSLTWTMTGAVTDFSPGSGINFIPDYTFPVGITTIEYTAYDGSTTETCSFTVEINDIEDPTASNPADINVQCLADVPAADPAVVTDEADNCGTPTVTFI
ncbi:HYR domain-containing protein, partial [Tamlana flava]|uniref:HYR domain-containing protein n=1 Tax=Tamlana flava TaxID=3158572 RepID=UPI00351B140E